MRSPCRDVTPRGTAHPTRGGERLVGIERVESLDTGEEEPLAEPGPQAGAGEPAAET